MFFLCFGDEGVSGGFTSEHMKFKIPVVSSSSSLGGSWIYVSLMLSREILVGYRDL